MIRPAMQEAPPLESQQSQIRLIHGDRLQRRIAPHTAAVGTQHSPCENRPFCTLIAQFMVPRAPGGRPAQPAAKDTEISVYMCSWF